MERPAAVAERRAARGPLVVRSRYGLDIDPSCHATAAGNDVRWMFGSVEGLSRRGKPIRIPLFGLDIAPETLLAAIVAMSHQASTDSGASRRQTP